MVCLSIAIAALFIFMLSADEPKSVPLIVILGITSFGMVLSMILKFKSARAVKADSNDQLVRVETVVEQLFKPSYTNMILYHSSAITMIMILFTRLIATDHFGGRVVNLNFGMKVSSGEVTGYNYAMDEFNFATVGHLGQGFLSCLLAYPSIVGMIAKLCGDRNGNRFIFKSPNVPVLLFLQLLAACMTLYPTYSMIKRLYKDAESFSRTSNMNNVGEWVLGYIVANGIGWMVSALLQMKLLKHAGMSDPEGDELKSSEVLEKLRVHTAHDTLLRGNESYGFGKSSEYPSDIRASKIVTALSTALLVLLSITTLLTGVFIGNTWNYDDDEEVVRSDTEMIIQFILYYVLVLILMLFISKEPKSME